MDIEYEMYLTQLLAAKGCTTVYRTYMQNPYFMGKGRRTLATNLALFLQIRSGYICKTKQCFPSLFRQSRCYVQCKFVKNKQ